eukprot:221206_1
MGQSLSKLRLNSLKRFDNSDIIIIDREIFTNIINLWFNTSNIKNATNINISVIIKCSFNYYYASPNIDILCTFSDYSCDTDDAMSFQKQSIIHSNGKVIYKERGWGRKEYIKCHLSNKQIRKLMSYLIKLQINFRDCQGDPNFIIYDQTFKHCGKEIAPFYNVDIINYANIYRTKK